MSMRRSLLWSYGGQALAFLVGFGASVVIARLLTPFEFGVFALANSITGLLSIISGLGLSQYIIREKELTRQSLRSAFTVNLLLQALLVVLMVGASFTIAPTFGTGVTSVLLVLALNPVISVIEFLPKALLQRDMRFSVISASSIVNALVSAALTIPLAYLGWGAMSIAIAVAAAHLVCALMVIIARPEGALMRPTRRGLRAIAVFGAQMLSVAGASQAANRLSDVGLARLQGTVGLGYYTRASQLFAQLFYSVYGLATGVLFAKMSQDFHRTGEIRKIYLDSVAMLTGLLWPVCIGLAVLSRPFIHIVYGPRWAGAAVPLSLLMIAMFVNLSFAMNWELFVLRKETGRQARFELTRAVAGTILFLGGAWFSIIAAAAARVAEALLSYALYNPHMPRMIGCEKRELHQVHRRGAVVTVLAVGPALGLMLVNGFDPATGYAALMLAIGAGIALWAAGLFALDHPLAAEARVLLRMALRRGPAGGL